MLDILDVQTAAENGSVLHACLHHLIVIRAVNGIGVCLPKNLSWIVIFEKLRSSNHSDFHSGGDGDPVCRR